MGTNNKAANAAITVALSAFDACETECDVADVDYDFVVNAYGEGRGSEETFCAAADRCIAASKALSKAAAALGEAHTARWS